MYRKALANIYNVRIRAQNTVISSSSSCKNVCDVSSVYWATGLSSHRSLASSGSSNNKNKDVPATFSEDGKKKAEMGTVKTKTQNTEMKKSADTPTKNKTGKPSINAMKVDVTTVKKVKQTRTWKKASAEDRQDGLQPALVAAASAAAATLPDSQRVESELLQQLRKYKTDCESMIRHNISSEPALVDTASAAAATLPDSQHVESELLQQLRKYKTDPGSMISHNIRDIIAQMEIEVTDVNPQKRQPSQRHLDEEWKLKKTSMFQSKRLNIFKSELEEELSEQASGLTLWDIDWANAIVESTNQRPRNGFEEMIKWTNEGKLWQYPINNEAGMDEEADVPFYEHVFLEKHLESFPQRGPVRHFMDLVIRGLSQNHQLTVQQKKDHINWFEDYFKEKQNVLKEAEA